MNAGSYNAGLSVAERVTNFSNPAASNSTPSSSAPPSQQALQALLAFSSLHQQIRSRRDGQRQEPGAELWEIEDFVLDEVIQLVAERAQHITGADGVAIALAAGNAIVCRGSAGNMSPDPGARLDPGSGFSGACLRGAQVIRCDDTECDARVNVAASRSLGARSIVAVPIAGAHGVIGLIEAFSVDAFGFNDSDVSSLKLLAELILAALKPAEEDRMAEISRQVIEQTRDEPASHPAHESEVLQSLIAASSMEGFSAGRRPGLSLVLSCTVVALLLGGGLWWRIHQHSSGSGSADLPGHSISEPGSGGSNPQPVSPLPAESNAGPAS